MKDKMLYFTAGFIISTFVSIIILSANPTPKTEIICGGCGSPKWWSVITNNE